MSSSSAFYARLQEQLGELEAAWKADPATWADDAAAAGRRFRLETRGSNSLGDPMRPKIDAASGVVVFNLIGSKGAVVAWRPEAPNPVAPSSGGGDADDDGTAADGTDGDGDKGLGRPAVAAVGADAHPDAAGWVRRGVGAACAAVAADLRGDGHVLAAWGPLNSPRGVGLSRGVPGRAAAAAAAAAGGGGGGGDDDVVVATVSENSADQLVQVEFAEGFEAVRQVPDWKGTKIKCHYTQDLTTGFIDGKHVAWVSGGPGEDAMLVDVASGELITSVKTHCGWGWSTAIDPTNDEALCLCDNGALVYNLADKNLVAGKLNVGDAPDDHGGFEKNVFIDDDGNRLFSTGDTVHCLDPSGEQVATLKFPFEELGLYGIAASPQHSLFVCAFTGGRVVAYRGGSSARVKAARA